MVLSEKYHLVMKSVFFVTIFMLFTLPVRADENAIAYVKVLNGACFVEADGDVRVLKIGDALYKNDVIKTEDESSLGVSFRDNTMVSLGSNSTLQLNRFEFEPDNQKLTFAVQLFEGTLLYISGLISKLTKNPEEDLQITTPAGTISVRGTRLFVNAE